MRKITFISMLGSDENHHTLIPPINTVLHGGQIKSLRERNERWWRLELSAEPSMAYHEPPKPYTETV